VHIIVNLNNRYYRFFRQMITNVGRLIVTHINAIHRLVRKFTKKIIMHYLS